jgi:2-keto-4-pentenoate hydratase/2-oxohepta-3-ene-1,7-dioic acid hydratase in catechol pathway
MRGAKAGGNDVAQWVRFEAGGKRGFGTLERNEIAVHSGDMFNAPKPTGEIVKLANVLLLTPTEPTKMIALWNNLRALGAKLGVAAPDEPLYLLKAPSSFLAHGQTIVRPASYSGKIVYEGELGIVIGKRIANGSEADAAQAIFGYTIVNDVTAADILNKNPTFPQWARAKSFDTFGVFGPAVTTGIDPAGLTIRTILNGEERQNYPVSDMYFQPVALVAALSRDMTLMPGDIIACGTSVGVGVMKEPKNTVEVVIDGVGTLRNTFEQ